jgi:hypothetical protein
MAKLGDVSHGATLALEVERVGGHEITPRSHEDGTARSACRAVSELEPVSVRAVRTLSPCFVERRTPVSGSNEEPPSCAPETGVLNEHLFISGAALLTESASPRTIAVLR